MSKPCDYHHAIVVQSDANFETYENHLYRFIEFGGKKKSIIIFSLQESVDIDRIVSLGKNLRLTISSSYSDIICPDIDFVVVGSDSNFSQSINSGIKYLEDKYGTPKFITVCKDTISVTKNWSKYLERASSSEYIVTENILVQEEIPVETEEMLPNAKIGFSGPLSRIPDSTQGVDHKSELGLDKYAEKIHTANVGNYLFTTRLDPFCVTFTKDCLLDLWDDNIGGIYDEKIEGSLYQTDDLQIRAEHKGWASVVATDCYIDFNSPKTNQEEKSILLKDEIYLFKKYPSNLLRNQKISGCYMIDLATINEIVQLKSSIARTAKSVDTICLALHGNPSVCLTSYDSVLAQQLPALDFKYLNQCLEARGKEDENKIISKLTKEWVEENLKICQNQYQQFMASRPDLESTDNVNYNIPVYIASDNQGITKRDALNNLYELAYSLDSDWILSLQKNDVLEDRVDYELLHKICSTPNWRTKIFESSIINHWENTSLVRRSSGFNKMFASNLFRCSKYRQKIVDGGEEGVQFSLSPETGRFSKKTTSSRIRNLSQIREADRVASHKSIKMFRSKLSNQSTEDVDELVRRNVSVKFYFPRNGIGFFMLNHKDEEVPDLHHWIKETYALCDKQVIVWTEKWEEEDKVWMGLSLDDLPSADSWYETGPSWEFAFLSKIYSFTVLHKYLDKENKIGLSHCRNAGIDFLEKNNVDEKIRWALFFDPDERAADETELSRSILKLAENEEAWAYLFHFRNLLNSFSSSGVQIASPSESIRMFLLNKENPMRMNGLIHEGFEKYFDSMKKHGVTPLVVDSSLILINKGLAMEPEKMANKLHNYGVSLLDSLIDEPEDSKSWVSLGLQYLNDRNTDAGIYCFKRACDYAGNSFLPFKELGTQYLRMAYQCINLSAQRLDKDHTFIPVAKLITKNIESWNLSLPIIDTDGYTLTDDDIAKEKAISLGIFKDD